MTLNTEQSVEIDGRTLTLEQVERIAREDITVRLAPAARERMVRSRSVVETAVADGDVIYGISTGFGKLSDRLIPPSELARLQLNLLRSHAAGVGKPFSAPVTRAIMLLRANTLAGGWSGVRPIVCESLLSLLNSRIVPRIPAQGSVGASGDLAPLAHLGLVLIGEGEVLVHGDSVPSKSILSSSGLEPLRLEAKEGLALINGTQVMTAIGALTLLAAERLVDAAEVAGALSLEATCGTRAALGEPIHDSRPHPGQRTSARRLRELLGSDSEISRSHADCGVVQDSYSLRCMPQVHGAVRDTLTHVRRVLEIEINSATDNPLIFHDADGSVVLSGGNFHGAPVAAALDFLAISVTDLGGISERRIAGLIDERESGLPAFLAQDPGLESGLMAHQITAAALTSECKGLAHPASVDTVPTGADREDHVSMGVWAARKAQLVVDNVERIVAIELNAAARAVEMRRPLRTSEELERVIAKIRNSEEVDFSDRPGTDHIERLRAMIQQGTLR